MSEPKEITPRKTRGGKKLVFDPTIDGRSSRPGGSSHGKRKVEAAVVSGTPPRHQPRRRIGDGVDEGDEDDNISRLVATNTSTPEARSSSSLEAPSSPKGLFRLRRSTRAKGRETGEKVPCSRYGPLRHLEYPDFEFCDKWQPPVTWRTRNKRTYMINNKRLILVIKE